MKMFKLIAAAAALAHVAAFAQVWPAERMLAEVNSPTIRVRDKAGETDQFDRDALVRSVEVLRRLAPAYGMSAPPPLYVTPSKSPNAFATLDKSGKPVVAINIAMLKLAGNNEDHLAVVMSHELGHAQAHHMSEGAQRAAAVSLLGAILGAAVDINQAKHGHNTGGLGTVFGGVGANLLNAKFTRDQEREADALGITAMAKAGYDPATAAGFWKMMAARGGGGSGAWMDNHPSHLEREQALTALAQELAPVYASNARPSTTVAGLSRTEITLAASGSDDGYPRSAYTSLDPTAGEVSSDAVYARARAAFKERHYADALPLFQESANAGDERAIAALGAYAQFGYLRSPDLTEARELYFKSAQKGFGRAMAMLGELHSRGQGGSKNEEEGMKWWALGAAREDARALSDLAIVHLQGANGALRDSAKARQYAERAAKTNDPLGKAVLGTMMRDGVGGNPAPQEGFALISSVANEVPFARYQLGVSYERGLGVPADRGRAIEAYRAAAQGGVASAKARLRALAAD